MTTRLMLVEKEIGKVGVTILCLKISSAYTTWLLEKVKAVKDPEYN